MVFDDYLNMKEEKNKLSAKDISAFIDFLDKKGAKTNIHVLEGNEYICQDEFVYFDLYENAITTTTTNGNYIEFIRY